MSNFPANDGRFNQPGQPGPYAQNYGSTQPGPFNSTGQQQQQPLDPRQQELQQIINYRFTPEELRVIKQCEIDSLLKRSFPIGFGLGFGTFWGIRKGMIKTGRFGAWPKILGASVFGYIIGRLSYMKVCQERIMELPNSRLAQMLRMRSRKYNPSLTEDSYATDAGFATALTLAPLQTDDFSQPSSLNMDIDPPNDDDHYVPTREGTNDLNEDLNIPTRKNFVSYDELRQKNRDDFNRSHRFAAAGPRYGRPQAPPAAPPLAANIEVPITPAQSVPGIRDPSEYERHPFADNDRRRADLRTNSSYGNKNQYGDTWTE